MILIQAQSLDSCTAAAVFVSYRVSPLDITQLKSNTITVTEHRSRGSLGRVP